MPWPQDGAEEKFCRAALMNSTRGLSGNFTNAQNPAMLRGAIFKGTRTIIQRGKMQGKISCEGTQI
jgi:hypothetical protein